MKVYNRVKTEKGWRYEIVAEGVGIKTSLLKPPFYVRDQKNGKQFWHRLEAETFADAKKEAEQEVIKLEAEAKGLVVEDDGKDKRFPFKASIEKFITDAENAGRKPKSITQYKLSLYGFKAALPTVHWLEDLTVESLKTFVGAMRREKFSDKTMETRLTIVGGFLNEFLGATRPILKGTHRPRAIEKTPQPYEEEDIKALFGALKNETDRLRFDFFLRTAAREQEVQFAAWSDINFAAKTFTVQPKHDVGFSAKNREARTIPLRDSLVDALKEHKKTNGASRWIFPTKQGNPDGHMLRALKTIALKAGLNCGHCHATLTVGEGKAKKQVEVTCKTHAVCDKWQLHKFRKTCATRWERNGMPVSEIQRLLGHDSLETTQKYLGVSGQKHVRDAINSGD